MVICTVFCQSFANINKFKSCPNFRTMMQASVLQGERHDVTFSTIHEAFDYIVTHNNEARATGIRFENCYLDHVEVSRLSTKLCHILFNRLPFTTVY